MAAAASEAAFAAPFAPHDNAFQYAHQYRDPSWGGYYLRARWYAPSLPSFTSRDPVHHINRYGYGGGDPVMNVDPSGRSYRGFARGLGHVLRDVNAGPGGHVARFFLSPLLLPLQIVAAPRAFWKQLHHDTAGIDVFLAGGVVLEGAVSAAGAFSFMPPTLLFKLRMGGEGLLGVEQSFAQASSHDFHRFNVDTLVAGLESTFGPEVVGRVGAGLGYQPFNLKADRLERFITRKLGPFPEQGDALLLRVEDRGVRGLPRWTTPWQETLGTGLYHERLIAITRDTLHTTLYGSVGIETSMADRLDFDADERASFRFHYGGKVNDFDAELFHSSMRGGLPTVMTAGSIMMHGGTIPADFVGGLRSYSQQHSAAIQALLGVR
ncbi:MAG TPA: RHS repeat-associated core domain-containing protein [Rhizomicrobium sp.]